MKKKNRTVLFILTFIVILSLSLQVLVNELPGVFAEQKGNSLNVYPTTPEGVVEAFVKMDFDGISDEAIGDAKKRLYYTTWDLWPGSDVVDISLQYRIVKLNEDMQEAKVRVVHEYLGTLGIEYLKIERKTQEVVYSLEKDKGIWKITSPSHPHYVSVNTAIKILEWGIKTYKSDKERVKEIRKNINILKKYL